jgi:hypothetical protein
MPAPDCIDPVVDHVSDLGHTDRADDDDTDGTPDPVRSATSVGPR